MTDAEKARSKRDEFRRTLRMTKALLSNLRAGARAIGDRQLIVAVSDARGCLDAADARVDELEAEQIKIRMGESKVYQKQIATLTRERADAMELINPSMPGSGLTDAIRQKLQALVSEQDNAAEASRQLDEARAEVERLRKELRRREEERS